MKCRFVVLCFVLILVGCDPVQLNIPSEEFNSICIDGVKYVTRNSGISVMFNPDSTVVTCNR